MTYTQDFVDERREALTGGTELYDMKQEFTGKEDIQKTLQVDASPQKTSPKRLQNPLVISPPSQYNAR